MGQASPPRPITNLLVCHIYPGLTLCSGCLCHILYPSIFLRPKTLEQCKCTHNFFITLEKIAIFSSLGITRKTNRPTHQLLLLTRNAEAAHLKYTHKLHVDINTPNTLYNEWSVTSSWLPHDELVPNQNVTRHAAIGEQPQQGMHGSRSMFLQDCAGKWMIVACSMSWLWHSRPCTNTTHIFRTKLHNLSLKPTTRRHWLNTTQ
jgi:hypothetical protein